MKEKIAFERGYRVINGLCYNPSNQEIKGYYDSDGYRVFNIRIEGKVKKVRLHRLIAYEKYKEKIFEKGMEVRHLNSDKLDNLHNNISIGTHSENMLDMCPNKRKQKALHATSFIRKYNKEVVKDFHKINNNYQETMLKFGITSKGTLHYILKK